MKVAGTGLIVWVCCLAGCYEAVPEVVPEHSERMDSRPRARQETRSGSPGSAGAASGEDEPGGSSPLDPIDDLSPRWVLEDEIDNARDLGGTPLPSGAVVARGAVFRGPPLRLNAAGCDAFHQLGIRTVIDLRIDSETKQVPQATCVQQSAEVVSAPLPVPYNVSPRDYIAILDSRASIASIFDRLGDAEAYPIYFHCTWGRDRTGVIAAVLLRALGASRATIMREYELSKLHVGAYPQSLEAALEAIEQRGGIDAYLASAGVSDAQLATLRRRLIAGAQ